MFDGDVDPAIAALINDAANAANGNGHNSSTAAANKRKHGEAVGWGSNIRGDFEILQAIDNDSLIEKLRTLDPAVNIQDYWVTDPNTGVGFWDRFGIIEDVWLTSQYVGTGLEKALVPMRVEIQRICARAPAGNSATELIPGILILGNAEAARDTSLMRHLNVTSVINMAPQTVRTGGKAYYDAGMLLSGGAGQVVDFIEIWADDLADYNILSHMDAVWNCFTARGRGTNAGSRAGACFIHCEAGVNRSGALATAILMRQAQLAQGAHHVSAEDLFWNSWSSIAEKRGGTRGILTNESFQRQLLMFARLGCNWWSDRWATGMCCLWLDPREKSMAAFRVFVEEIARDVVGSSPLVLPDNRQWLIVYIRDGVMRGETKAQLANPFDLDVPSGAYLRSEKRVRAYAESMLKKKTAV